MRYALERGVAGEGLDMLDPALDWAYLERLVLLRPGAGRRQGRPRAARTRCSPPSTAPRASSSRTTAVASSTVRCRRSRRCLPIVEAVGDRLEVLLDGGIRRGTDVATALALGADAVLAGRLPLWGLAAGGEDGRAEGARAAPRGARESRCT